MGAGTYMAGGVLLCALMGAVTNQHYSWLTLSCAALGSLLPHALDRPWLSERVGPQTVTHSLLGLMVVGVVLSPWLLARHAALFTAILLGYTSHLLLDAASDRGVLLFYPSRARAVLPRHPLSRIVPGSPREARLRHWLLALWLVALPLNAVGLRGLLHQLIPVTQFAVEDYLTYSRQGRRVFVEFSGRFTDSQRTVSGRWEVLDVPSSTSLLAEDSKGKRYTVGTHPHDTIQVFTIRARQGPPMDVQLQVVHLHDQALGDLLPMIPAEGRTYLIGVVKTPDDIAADLSLDQFRPIQVGTTQVELRYATLHDLQQQHLTSLLVTEGELLLRTVRDARDQPKISESSATPVIQVEPSHRTVRLTVHQVQEPQEILVHPDQLVRQGQLLADLRTVRSKLLIDRRIIQAQLAAAQASVERLRLTHYQEIVFKHTEDALAGVQRELTVLRAQQAQELRRAQAPVDAAWAKLERLDQALAATTVRSPVSGRILSVRLHQSIATIHVLADD